MRSPRFWHQPLSWRAVALMPFGWIYGLTVMIRGALTKPYTPNIPVLCVGNFTLGGAGKTPCVIYIAGQLRKQGHNPFIVTRGYGGRLKGPHIVNATQDSAADVGDEALLHTRHAPTIIAKDRVAGAKEAEAQGATVILLDDGMQNPRLAKTFTLAVVDTQSGVGNGMVFPAGPLRAPLAWQMKRVNAFITIGSSSPAKSPFLQRIRNKKILTARLQPISAEWINSCRVLAFCGIGQPQKFHATLMELGADIARFCAFPDHYVYGAADAKKLIADAATGNLTLVTTEKDMARLQSCGETRAQLAGLANVVAVKFIPDDTSGFDEWLTRALSLPSGA